MATKIKRVWTGAENYLFIYGVTAKAEVVFKTSMNIKYTRVEPSFIQDNRCYFGAFDVPIAWLEDVPIIEIKK